MNTTIPIRSAPIIGNVTHCLNGIAPPPLPFVRHQPPTVHRYDDLRRIADHVAQHFRISLSMLHSKTRKMPVVWPRQVAMYISYNLTAQSSWAIAREFNKRSHVTVLCACRAVRNRMATEPDTRAEIEALMKELSQ